MHNATPRPQPGQETNRNLSISAGLVAAAFLPGQLLEDQW